MHRSIGATFWKAAGVMAVVMAIGAAGSASASAAEWHVGGSPLSGSASLASKTSTPEGVLITTALGLHIKCKHIELKGADIAAPDGGQIEHLVFSGCAFQGDSEGCALESETIETQPLTVEAALGVKSPEDTLLLKPKSGTLFAGYGVTGETCLSSGKNRWVGKAKFLLPKGGEELAEQEVVPNTGREELKEGSGEVKFSAGSFGAKLSSGSAWSFR